MTPLARTALSAETLQLGAGSGACFFRESHLTCCLLVLPDKGEGFDWRQLVLLGNTTHNMLRKYKVCKCASVCSSALLGLLAPVAPPELSVERGTGAVQGNMHLTLPLTSQSVAWIP